MDAALALNARTGEYHRMIAQCLFCGESLVRRLDRETLMTRSAFGAAVVRCERCGLVFAWPRPAETAAEYEAAYFEAYDDAGMPQVAEARMTRFGRRLQKAAAAPGRLLEIGGGHGAFLGVARTLGWDVLGLDVSRWAAEQVQRKYGVEVLVGSVDHPDLPPAAFDVVHMSHVLEHMCDPIESLRRVRHLLRPGGRVIIEVPNEFENLYTWARLRSGSARPYPVKSTHLWFFTPRTLMRAVSTAGFGIDRVASFRDVDDQRWLRRIAKRAMHRLERVVDRGPLLELVASVPTAPSRVI